MQRRVRRYTALTAYLSPQLNFSVQSNEPLPSAEATARSFLNTVSERRSNAAALLPALTTLHIHLRMYAGDGELGGAGAVCAPVLLQVMTTHPNSAPVCHVFANRQRTEL